MTSRTFSRTFPLCLAALLATPTLAFAAGFPMSCESLDATTQQPSTTFRPGEKMLLRLTMDIPQEGAGKQVDVKVAARLRVSRFSVPYTLHDMKFTLPNDHPNPTDPGKNLPYIGTRVKEITFDIPASFPTGTFKLKAKAAIEDIGKESCKVGFEIIQ